MDAESAKTATALALAKQRESAAKERADKEARQSAQDEWSRTEGFRRAWSEVQTLISGATLAGKYHAAYATTNGIIADSVLERLLADKYYAHMQDLYVDACNEYGDSGEGMHGAYTSHVIHINWGSMGICPSCDEEFKRRR